MSPAAFPDPYVAAVAVLARDELIARLRSQHSEEQIFVPGSGDESCVRGASYELRVAADYLILPDGQRFWPDSPEPIGRAMKASFDLRPGQVAFVSSVEKLRMPWDLAGNIAPKFRLALDGLLIMGGMLVDPGYGRLSKKDEKWEECQEGERLHFQLANLGVEKLKIEPEVTRVAAIQFLPIEGDARREEPNREILPMERLEIPTSEKLLRNFFHPHAHEPLPQLAFFSNAGKVEARVAALESRAETTEIVLASSDKAIDRIIIFGFYLLLVTILGVALAALINAISG